jgi:hypothetical protein
MRWRIEDDSILDRSIDYNRILRDADGCFDEMSRMICHRRQQQHTII